MEGDIDAGTPSPPAPKRLRLRQKTPAPREEQADQPLAPELPAVLGEAEDAEGFDGVAEAPLNAFLKKKFHNAYHHWWCRKVQYKSLSLRQQQRYHAYYHLRLLSPADRQRRLTSFVKDMPCMAALAESVQRHWSDGHLKRSMKDQGSVLMTWNGPWGVLREGISPVVAEPLAGQTAPSPSAVSSPSPTQIVVHDALSPEPSTPTVPPSLDPEADMKRVERAAQAVRDDPRSEQLWEDVGRIVSALRAQHRHMFVAWALEVCPRTLEATGELRVHVHVACVSQRGRLGFNPLSVLYRGCPPSDAAADIGQGGRGRLALAGIAYLALPKVCTVFAGCAAALFTGLPVSAQCVFNGVQARKILLQTAHELMCRIPKQIDRNLDQLSRYRAEQGSLAVARVQAWRRSNGHEARRPRRVYTEA